MLVNLSNHPFGVWGDDQKIAAKNLFGEVVDLAFPAIPPEADTSDVKKMAVEFADRIGLMNPDSVHIMGEATFSFLIVQILMDRGISCFASTTHREVVDNGSQGKTSIFRFVRFRAYGR